MRNFANWCGELVGAAGRLIDPETDEPSADSALRIAKW